MNKNNYFVMAMHMMAQLYENITVKGYWDIEIPVENYGNHYIDVMKNLSDAGYIKIDRTSKRITHDGIMFMFTNPFMKEAFKWLQENGEELGYLPNMFYPDSNEYDAFITKTWGKGKG